MFVAAGVPFAPVNDVAAMSQHPQVLASGMVQEYSSPHFGALNSVARPVRFGGGIEQVGSPPPALGEHTHDVLREAGYTEAEIDGFRRAGAIGAA